MVVAALTGPRVALRAVREEDMAAIEPWYPEAALAVHGGGLEFGEQNVAYKIEEARASGKGVVLAIERHEEPAPIGLLEHGLDHPEDGWLSVGFIALAKAYRGWGYGSEAVRLLEGWARRGGLASRFYAEVPVGNGLGLYFWLRLGYRPASADEVDWPRDKSRDMMPMVRFSDEAGM